MKMKEYDVEVIKMMRNNNMATLENDVIGNRDIYFMLDYFDLLFHTSLRGKDKVYNKFWNMEGEKLGESLVYKAAYKVLSLYAERDSKQTDIWSRPHNCLSNFPFLGIIQINIVYHVFEQELLVEDTLEFLEKQIEMQIMEQMGEKRQKNVYGDIGYQSKMYRSATSSDFTLVIKSSNLQTIFEISMIINNMIILYENCNFNFNTYTNVGIECAQNEKGEFETFTKELVIENKLCGFALRVTASSRFLNDKYGKECNLSENTNGLFGRYDFSMKISMQDFADIYPVLCKSKLLGDVNISLKEMPENLVELLSKEIGNGDIRIINERALISLENIDVGNETYEECKRTAIDELKRNEMQLKNVVNQVSSDLKEKMSEFDEMSAIFIEERRAFIDIKRELREVIATYVPQGLDHDSHVNWQILISDLRVLFQGIEGWEHAYWEIEDDNKKKSMREQFLGDLRITVEAINQYYKFLQNVNAQTWQAPLYEIQTQIDAEKLMIAYREVLYEYFYEYQNHYTDRSMFYPIVYPDMSIDTACIKAPFRSGCREKQQCEPKLLVCKVPSFEYYGRVYDMMPWILHEASHSLRTMDREQRNGYLINKIIYKVFEQAIYKILNVYTNDLGYYQLTTLERGVLHEMTACGIEYFYERNPECNDYDIYKLQTELNQYLYSYFNKRDNLLDENNNSEKLKLIIREMGKYCAELNLPLTDVKDLEKYLKDIGLMGNLFSQMYSALYTNLWGEEPDEDQWRIITYDSAAFEQGLADVITNIKNEKNKYRVREFRFRIRELNRLHGVCCKLETQECENNEWINGFWKDCINKVRERIMLGEENDEGITEIYRIINMVFGSGEPITTYAIKHVKRTFNILSAETVYDLVERETSIYREACADIYMAAALGLNVFGYCRHVFQTTSEIGIENNMRWENGVNVQRYRTVIAVLFYGTRKECESNIKNGRKLQNVILKQGWKYCDCTLKCLEEGMLEEYKENDDGRKELVKFFVELLRDNVNALFKSIKHEEGVEAIKHSVFTVYTRKNMDIDKEFSEEAEKIKGIIQTYQDIEDAIEAYRHVIYRIRYFIYSLAIIIKNNGLVIDSDELKHMREIYRDYRKRVKGQNKKYQFVSQFYNDPETAKSMLPSKMLDRTIRFVEEYYYRNRFKIMSSSEIKREVEECGGLK